MPGPKIVVQCLKTLKEEEATLKDQLNSISLPRDERSQWGDPLYCMMVTSRNNGQGEERLKEVQAALQRLTQGTFGTCLDCGSDINEERLLAVPSAKRCITCQSAWENSRKW